MPHRVARAPTKQSESISFDSTELMTETGGGDNWADHVQWDTERGRDVCSTQLALGILGDKAQG
jgi:hypothetical protein